MASLTIESVMANKKGAGRPALPKEDRKQQVNLRLPPWLNNWLNAQSEDKTHLIEVAVIKQYGLSKPE